MYFIDFNTSILLYKDLVLILGILRIYLLLVAFFSCQFQLYTFNDYFSHTDSRDSAVGIATG
jgi:hypothetical protein